MAVKQNFIIKDENLNEEYIICGQTGIYTNDGYKKNSLNHPILTEDDNTERFLLIDFWQLGIFGSENCKQTYDKENGINIIDEKDICNFAQQCVQHITEGLEQKIVQTIKEEIEEDGGETIKLINNKGSE